MIYKLATLSVQLMFAPPLLLLTVNQLHLLHPVQTRGGGGECLQPSVVSILLGLAPSLVRTHTVLLITKKGHLFLAVQLLQ